MHHIKHGGHEGPPQNSCHLNSHDAVAFWVASLRVFPLLRKIPKTILPHFDEGVTEAAVIISANCAVVTQEFFFTLDVEVAQLASCFRLLSVFFCLQSCAIKQLKLIWRSKSQPSVFKHCSISWLVGNFQCGARVRGNKIFPFELTEWSELFPIMTTSKSKQDKNAFQSNCLSSHGRKNVFGLSLLMLIPKLIAYRDTFEWIFGSRATRRSGHPIILSGG